MSIVTDFENEYLSSRPESRAATFQPTAAPTAASEEPMNEDNMPLSDSELAEAAAAADAEKSRGSPRAPEIVWNARVRKMEARMRAEGIPQASENNILGAPDMRLDTPTGPDPKALEILREMRAAVNPISGQRYVDGRDASAQAMRELLFFSQCQVEAGQPLDMALVRQAREGIKADTAEAARLKAKADAEELQRFRDNR